MIGTASKHNHELVYALGATPIDYKAENVVQRVRQLTEGGVDAAFDHIGGFRQLRGSYRSVRTGGRLVWYGVAATKTSGIRVIPISIATLLILSVLPDGKRVRFASDSAEHTKKTLPKLFALLQEGRLKPVIAERIPLAEARRAHEAIERGGYAGKFVLVPDATQGETP